MTHWKTNVTLFFLSLLSLVFCRLWAAGNQPETNSRHSGLLPEFLCEFILYCLIGWWDLACVGLWCSHMEYCRGPWRQFYHLSSGCANVHSHGFWEELLLLLQKPHNFLPTQAQCRLLCIGSQHLAPWASAVTQEPALWIDIWSFYLCFLLLSSLRQEVSILSCAFAM